MKVLTTGEAATICHVGNTIVQEWCDHGLIKGCYRRPGTRGKTDRRIPLPSLIDFMLANEIPLGDLADVGFIRVLLVSPDSMFARCLEDRAFKLAIASNSFDAGAIFEKFRPACPVAIVPFCVVLDAKLGQEAVQICDMVRESASPKNPIFVELVSRPFSAKGMVERIKEVVRKKSA